MTDPLAAPPAARRHHASAPAWVGVVLSVLAMLAGAVNWQRNEDLREIEQRLMDQSKHQVKLHQLVREEVGELRQDVRELRTIMLNRGGG